MERIVRFKTFLRASYLRKQEFLIFFKKLLKADLISTFRNGKKKLLKKSDFSLTPLYFWYSVTLQYATIHKTLFISVLCDFQILLLEVINSFAP